MSQEIQKEIKFIAIYGRVSTSNQEIEGTIETQFAAIREFAQQRGYIIVQQYMDNGWSGDNLERPGLDQLRMDAKRKEWEAVLIYDPDRLSRRYTHQEVVMDELKERKIETLFVTVPPILTDDDQLMYEVRGSFAKYERVKIRERFRIGKLRKVMEGHVLTTEAPYGYTYIRNDKEKKKHGRYKINKEEAEVVRMIFGWIGNDGLALRQVVRKLQELGIQPRKSKRGVWNTSTLATMCQNKAYIGEAHYGSTYAVVPENPIIKDKNRKVKKSSRKLRPESEWMASKIPVPVIVERALFQKVRAQLDQNRLLSQRNTKNEYLLSGRIFCACGTRRNGEGPQKGKHLYYRCSNRVYNFPLPPTCSERGINARIADKLVWNRILELMSSPEILTAYMERWTNKREGKKEPAEGEVEVMQREINKLQSHLDRYLKAYGAKIISLSELRKLRDAIDKRINVLEESIGKAKQEKHEARVEIFPSGDEIREFTTLASKTLQDLNFEAKRVIVRSTVEKIIGTQKQLEVVGKILITPFNYVKQQTECRNCRITKRWKINLVQGAHEKSGRY